MGSYRSRACLHRAAATMCNKRLLLSTARAHVLEKGFAQCVTSARPKKAPQQIQKILSMFC